MVLEALRERVGDAAFFCILRTWASSHRDRNGTTTEFIALAQNVSKQRLTALFDTWLFGPGKPPSAPTPAVKGADPGSAASARTANATAAPNSRAVLARLNQRDLGFRP